MLIKNNKRLLYLAVTLVIIILGIVSRKLIFIPLFVGDILYAIMVYFGLRMLFLTQLKLTIILSILFCFTIEFSQTVSWQWLKSIRNTTFGHYILGEGFLWMDLCYYLIGCYTAYFIDKIFTKN